jgi:O6-methylguanine-DNA--protein-cysteine methyltransferase
VSTSIKDIAVELRIQEALDMKKAVFSTPLGWAGAGIIEKGVCRIVLPRGSQKAVTSELARGTGRRSRAALSRAAGRDMQRAVKRLKQYFSGRHVAFDLPIDLSYYTPFQRAVWKAAASIPYGETRSYAWIAKRIGRPKAARAVGQAMGANPVPILIP